MQYHTPVLLKEVLTLLNVRSNINIIDCTLGDGGHAIEILKHTAPQGKVLGIDADAEAIRRVGQRVKNQELRSRLVLVNDNFRNLASIVEKHHFFPVHAVLLDLGVSSYQLDEGDRGFSFQKDTPLAMTFQCRSEGKTAAEIINTYSKQKLKEILKKYGEIKHAGVIAHNIVTSRKNKPIVTSSMLVRAVFPRLVASATQETEKRESQITGGIAETKGRGPFTKHQIKLLAKVWQAIRIEVNQELENIAFTLPQAVDIVAPSGRIAVISYHSLEDRIVKQFFKKEASSCECPKEVPVCRCKKIPSLRIVTKRIIQPTAIEIKKNSRARSAKLRVAEGV